MGKGDKTRARAMKKLQQAGQEWDLAPTPKRGKDKCFKERTRQQQPDLGAQEASLKVRASQMGKKPTEANLREVKAPWFTDEAGRALYISAPNEVADLWKVVEDWRKCENRFLHHVIGKRMYPGNDSIPHLPTPMETRDDVDYDLRTEEEKAGAAKQAFWAFCAHTDVLTEAQRRICMRGIWDSNPVFTVSYSMDVAPSPHEDGKWLWRWSGDRKWQKTLISAKTRSEAASARFKTPKLTYEGAAFVAAIKRLAVELTRG